MGTTLVGFSYVETLINVSNNLAVLTCGIAAYCWARRSIGRQSVWARIAIETLILAALGIYTLNNSFMTAPGRFYDARFIVLTLAGLVSGPLVAFMVMLAIVLMRVEIGGAGMVQGVFDAVVVFLIVAVYGVWMRRRGRTLAYRDLAILGGVVTVVTFNGWFFLSWQDAVANWSNPNLTLGLLSGNEIGLLILGSLVIWDQRLKVLERGLADRGAKFHDIIDNLPVSLATRDRHGELRFLNRRFRERYGEDIARFIGYDSNLLRRHLYSGEQYEQSLADERAAVATGKPQTRYLTDFMIGERRQSLWLTIFSMQDARGRPDGAAVIGVDVSELRQREKENERLRAQLRDVDRMKAVGQLAGGIAHDFNNLLGAMYGFASFLDEDLAERKTEQVYAKRILNLLDQAKSLVSQVLTFARADQVERDMIDLCPVLQQTVDLLRPSLPQNTSLTLDLAEQHLRLSANEAQIRQLMIALTLNCAQGFGGRAGTIAIGIDRLVVTGAELEASQFPAANHFAIGTLTPGGQYVRMTVTDDGPGMEQAILDRLMEPFFTTLNHGDPSGLGLSIVQGLIAAYGGAFRVVSLIDQGTAFHLYFPERETSPGV